MWVPPLVVMSRAKAEALGLTPLTAGGGAGRPSVKASCALTRQMAERKIANAARGNIK